MMCIRMRAKLLCQFAAAPSRRKLSPLLIWLLLLAIAPMAYGQTTKDLPLGPRVSTPLAALYVQYARANGLAGAGQAALANSQLVTDTGVLQMSGNKVLVQAVASGPTANLVRDLRAAGGRVTGSYRHLVSAYVPIAALDGLANLNSVACVLPGYRCQAGAGATTTQGDAAMRSNLVRQNLGLDGTGVKVGVLSDSFDHDGSGGSYAADIASGDLPNGVQVLDDSGGSNSDEGRAMLQIVHDVAPGAPLAFATAFTGEAAFADNIKALRDAGCKVIVDDVFYFDEPFFQDGIIAQAIQNVFGSGVTYCALANNHGRNSYESAFRTGNLRGAGSIGSANGAPGFRGGTTHNFNPAGNPVDDMQGFTLTNGQTMRISFQWDDAYVSADGVAGAASDLDIYVLNGAGTQVVAGSASANTGFDPVEVFEFTNNTGSTANFNLMIVLNSGPAPSRVKYINLTNGAPGLGSLEFATNSATAYGHSNEADALTVGAAFYQDTPPFGVNPPLQESYSSAGGIPILRDANGNSISPVIRNKPDVIGPDGGNTTFFGSDVEGDGFPNFFGTSAATPHVGALAALLLQAQPGLTPGQVYATLRSTAIDMGASGFDFDTGFGLVDGLNAIPANHAPVLDSSGVFSLAPINQNLADAANSGTLVSALIANAGANRITDADAGALQGLAIIGAATANGDWQFSTDNGATFNALGAVANNAATLLASDGATRIRFRPNPGFSGSVAAGLTFRAWDRTSGANGATNVDVSTNGGSTAFSLATATAAIRVNDLPVVDLNGTAAGLNFAATFTGNSGPVAVVDSSNLTVTDADDANLASATVTLANRPDGAAEALAAVTAGTGITAFYNATTGVLSLSGADSLLHYQQVLRSVTYNNAAVHPNGTTRSITFAVNDGAANSAVATTTLTVTGLNRPPVAFGDAVSTLEDTAVNVAVLANASDPDGDPISLLNVSTGAATHGSVTINPDQTIKYVPDPNFSGPATFSYTISDGLGGTATAGVTVAVTPVNDPPGFAAGPDQTVPQDAGPQTVASWATAISAGPPDESGQLLSFAATNDNNSLFLAQPAIGADGTLTYTSTPGATGTATVTVSLHDNGGTDNGGVDTSAPQTFRITITPVNHPPLGVADAATTVQDTAVNIPVLANDSDPDGNAVSVTGVTNGVHGTASINQDGTVRYTPNAGYLGSDSFTYTISDGQGGMATGTVTMTVTPVPTLTLTISRDHFSEGATGTAATCIVRRNTLLANSQIVTLSSSNAGKARVPTSVVIPAGLGFASFPVTAVNNTLVDGPQRVTLRAGATGFITGTVDLTVQDDEARSNLGISGHLTAAMLNANGDTVRVAVPGIKVKLFTGTVLRDIVTSDALGLYSFIRLPPGTYTVVPVATANLSFAPTSRSVTLLKAAATAVDFGATVRAQIGGQVTRLLADGSRQPLAGVTVTMRVAQRLLTVRTGTSGRYLFDNLTLASYALLPALQGTFFQPAVRTVTLTPTAPAQLAAHFVVKGSDLVKPIVIVRSPLAGTFSTALQPTLATGSASDRGGGGLALVAVALARFASATATTPIAFYNWSTRGFITTDTPSLVEKLATGTASWTVRGLPVLPAGCYGIRATALDAAANTTRSVFVRYTLTASAVRGAAAAPVQISTAAASSATGSVQLRFGAALDSDTAADAVHYQVRVDGREVTVESAAYDGITHTVLLGLPTGALHAGDSVVVQWSGVVDALARTLSGESGPIIAR